MNPRSKEESLRAYYSTLLRAGGRQHWWPAQTPFEVIVGAYLTQNTGWTNAELALRRLRAADLLNLEGIQSTSLSRLEALIRPAGYFRQKARRLKTFAAFVDQRYGGSLNHMFAQPTSSLRQELLELNGVGAETADSILLYAGQHPVFVVDAYARRILDRHDILAANAPYDEVRQLFERALAPLELEQHTEACAPAPNPHNLLSAVHPPSTMSLVKRSRLTQVFNDMHALVVGVGKHYCLKSTPRCEQCPLRTFLP